MNHFVEILFAGRILGVHATFTSLPCILKPRTSVGQEAIRGCRELKLMSKELATQTMTVFQVESRSLNIRGRYGTPS